MAKPLENIAESATVNIGGKPFYTLGKLAKLGGVPKTTMLRYARQGQGGGVKLEVYKEPCEHGRYYITKESGDNFVNRLVRV